MLVSGISEDSSYNLGEGLVKEKGADKYRRNKVPKNQRVSQQNYVGEDSSSNLIVPGRGKGNVNSREGRTGKRDSDPFG